MEQCGEANGDKPSRATIVTKSGAGGPRPSWGAERMLTRAGREHPRTPVHRGGALSDLTVHSVDVRERSEQTVESCHSEVERLNARPRFVGEWNRRKAR